MTLFSLEGGHKIKTIGSKEVMELKSERHETMRVWDGHWEGYIYRSYNAPEPRFGLLSSFARREGNAVYIGGASLFSLVVSYFIFYVFRDVLVPDALIVLADRFVNLVLFALMFLIPAATLGLTYLLTRKFPHFFWKEEVRWLRRRLRVPFTLSLHTEDLPPRLSWNYARDQETLENPERIASLPPGGADVESTLVAGELALESKAVMLATRRLTGKEMRPVLHVSNAASGTVLCLGLQHVLPTGEDSSLEQVAAQPGGRAVVAAEAVRALVQTLRAQKITLPASLGSL